MSKKILLLGGSRYAIPVIEVAHKMDIEVITCDFLPDNVAHKFSDLYCNISIIDKDAVLRVAERQHIDGVMSFACDPGVVTAAYVAEKMGLPSCGSYESVSILQNKKRFRQFLDDNGFNVPKARGYREKQKATSELEIFRFPVIVKPTDSAGSKGVSKVETKDELVKAIDHAIENSISKEFIIEEFLTSKGYPSDSECFSVDGDLKFISYSAQRFDDYCENPYAPVGFTWQSTISDDNKTVLSKELQRLLKLLNMKTSLYNVEARECIDGRAYLMEVSPRGGGNRLAEMLRYITGTDLIDCAVKAALGDEIPEIPPFTSKGFYSEIILHGRQSGSFTNVKISDTIKKYIVERDIWIRPGERIDSFSGANKAIGTLVFKFDDEDTMNRVMAEPYQYISIVTK